ncbi:hypothetical protein [Paenibacillus sp. PL91]|uniref:hypothetical protein n=1 Tax=Paenibacillus sp. PL91 TaxID=2729538 RepID=UPI00145CAF25|nr:hypothetical protein [Paenibacillus sp. PL91]MBC9204645.1 hypothetical protein [Paenibacillus sp. PL91]
MKDIIDYEVFKESLVLHYTSVIEQITSSEDCIDIYVLVLCTDVTNTSVELTWNTIGGLDKSYEEQIEIYGDDKYSIQEIKYEIAYFEYGEMYDWPEGLLVFTRTLDQYFSSLPSDTDEECDFYNEAYDHYCSRFIECMIEVLKQLQPAISKLNKTPDFISYVSDHDDVEAFQYAKETVPEELYNLVCAPYKN